MYDLQPESTPLRINILYLIAVLSYTTTCLTYIYMIFVWEDVITDDNVMNRVNDGARNAVYRVYVWKITNSVCLWSKLGRSNTLTCHLVHGNGYYAYWHLKYEIIAILIVNRYCSF